MVAPLEPGRVVAGRYRIESPIGEGGMGVVYRVRHLHTDEALAMKVLHPHVLRDENAVERFRREARAPARIASEHVARVTDADTAADLENAPFYVMELLHGMDLEQLVNAQGPLAPAVVAELLRQAARALDKAHAMGIVHRDLKPENLFLTHRDDGSPRVKLLDFGIARIADDAASAKKTQAGFIFGTPAYMAPEQALGEVDRVGPSTDVWALGLVAFKLLTGVDFWVAQTTTQLIALTLNGPIPAPSTRAPSLGPAFDRWFERCVARTPAERFATAGEAADALADALSVTLTPSLAPPSLALGAALRHASPWATRTASDGPMALASIPASPSRAAWRGAAVVGALVATLIAAVIAVIALAPRAASRSSAAAIASVAPIASNASVASIPVIAADPPIAPDAGAAPPLDERATTIPAPNASAEAPMPRAIAPIEHAPKGLTRGQRQRLAALQRLCAQGTFTEAECRAKQAAIAREP